MRKSQRTAKLTADQAEKIATLAKLGYQLSTADVAKLVGIAPRTLEQYIARGKGKELWERARAEARAELLTIIRNEAISGDTQAQRLLVTLLARDDTIATADQRLTAKDICELTGRSGSTVRKRAANGDFVPPGPDGRYKVRDLIAHFATVWDLLTKSRRELHRLREHTATGRTEEAEARRLVQIENARRRKRENDEAERKLISRENVHETYARLADAIRSESKNMAEELALKLTLEGAGLKAVQEARATFLRRVAATMNRNGGAETGTQEAGSCHAA